MSGARRVVAALALTLAVSACSSASDAVRGPEPVSHRPELLGQGAVAGHSWRLTVFSNPEGNLCMGMNDQLASATPADDVFVEDGCGFGPPDERMSSTTDTAEAGGIQLLWGPSPAGAVRVRIDTYSLAAQPSDGSAAAGPGCTASRPAHLWVPITHRLPSWVKPGGWFITHARVQGCGYLDAVFFDASGRVVPEPRW